MSNKFAPHSVESGCLIVKIKDRFDEENHSAIQSHILDLLKTKPSSLILDLNEVKTIRSSGLRVILRLAKSFQGKKWKFALLYAKNAENQQVSQILEVSGFAKIVSIYSDKKEALDQISA